ncbi:hypothetical protein BO94DRAFT_119129 [Aspergillus sclerotioniger CBS 115572]|uniref:Uncharacterized protein n=1 Tax=Aspergillus sclerotioniger CBS 115572 TaxID=1450535 RepID=A0A317WDJ3_9EURO|nr:hypothetical protein BO94DRAFT_119129 [Aspergillus sclerotioniger CBS 115572]PWY83128.1 hypothetical protein BO94DRAFT_119129 [Aspergillus sclerotioniger CBS 115572]
MYYSKYVVVVMVVVVVVVGMCPKTVPPVSPRQEKIQAAASQSPHAISKKKYSTNQAQTWGEPNRRPGADAKKETPTRMHENNTSPGDIYRSPT